MILSLEIWKNTITRQMGRRVHTTRLGGMKRTSYESRRDVRNFTCINSRIGFASADVCSNCDKDEPLEVSFLSSIATDVSELFSAVKPGKGEFLSTKEISEAICSRTSHEALDSFGGTFHQPASSLDKFRDFFPNERP